MVREWPGRIQATFELALSVIAALLHWETIHTKSPQEHVVEAWWTSTLDLWARTQKVTTKYYRPLFYPRYIGMYLLQNLLCILSSFSFSGVY